MSSRNHVEAVPISTQKFLQQYEGACQSYRPLGASLHFFRKNGYLAHPNEYKDGGRHGQMPGILATKWICKCSMSKAFHAQQHIK